MFLSTVKAYLDGLRIVSELNCDNHCSHGKFRKRASRGSLLCKGSMEQRSERGILVLGLGNLLLADEGVGIHAVRELQKRALPPEVDVIDGGTAGLSLLDLMQGYKRVIIVDAVDAGEEPGTILRFSPQEVASGAQAFPMSLHQAEVLKVLELATYLGQPLPPIVIYGVQPQAIDWSTELSPTLQAGLAKLVHAILEEMA